MSHLQSISSKIQDDICKNFTDHIQCVVYNVRTSESEQSLIVLISSMLFHAFDAAIYETVEEDAS